MTDHSFTASDDVILGGGPPPVLPGDTQAEARRLQRLADGVRGLRGRGASAKLGERVLMVVGGVLAPLGLVAVLLGWWGASQTPHLFEQVPYLISGGLFGLGLVFLGGFLYFAHWLTELVKEHRAQSTAMIEAVNRLEEAIGRVAGISGNGSSAAVTTDAVALVATNKGSMAHRPDCVVVAGKEGLRGVTPEDGLEPCKLCNPYEG